MPNAVYNPLGEDGLDKIEPATDPRLVSASVRTIEGATQGRDLTWVFPTISAVGRTRFGIRTVQIVWELTFATTNIGNLNSFENQIDDYFRTGKRYPLEREQGGQPWPYVDLQRYEKLELSKVVGGGWFRRARVVFVNMQP